jgi:hypothetical protein
MPDSVTRKVIDSAMYCIYEIKFFFYHKLLTILTIIAAGVLFGILFTW